MHEQVAIRGRERLAAVGRDHGRVEGTRHLPDPLVERRGELGREADARDQPVVLAQVERHVVQEQVLEPGRDAAVAGVLAGPRDEVEVAAVEDRRVPPRVEVGVLHRRGAGDPDPVPVAGVGDEPRDRSREGQQVRRAEVDVLEVRLELRIEYEAGRAQRVQPERRPRRGLGEDLGLVGEVDEPRPGLELPRARVVVRHRPVDVVEDADRRPQHLDLRVGVGEPEQRLQVARFEDVVRVREAHPLPGRDGQAPVAGRPLPRVRLVEDRHRDGRCVAPCLQPRQRAVGRAVVHGDDLERRPRAGPVPRSRR